MNRLICLLVIVIASVVVVSALPQAMAYNANFQSPTAAEQKLLDRYHISWGSGLWVTAPDKRWVTNPMAYAAGDAAYLRRQGFNAAVRTTEDGTVMIDIIGERGIKYSR